MQKIKCWDCEKELEVSIPPEIYEKCPRSMDGYRYIICKECGKLEDND